MYRIYSAGLIAFAMSSACAGEVSSTTSLGPDANGDRPDAGDDADAADAAPDAAFGVMEAPLHGAVLPGVTADIAVLFRGAHTAANADIAIQTLATPTDLDSWTTIATATTAGQPLPGTEVEPLYAWSASAAPAAGNPQRWPQGGVIRVRAVDADGIALHAFPHDAADCFDLNRGASWRGLVTACAAQVSAGAILVSPSPSPADAAAGPRFLDRKGTITPEQTLEYYAAIAAPATVDDFKTQYGFGGAGEVSAVYYNAGDLGIGREMHCTTFAATGGTGLACYVANYGLFGGEQQLAIDQTVAGFESGAHLGSFATVAMVYTPPISAPNSVQFLVYGPDGGALLTEALLDTRGDNVSIPNNCLNCHGSAATYDPAAQQVAGARFLPFDPAAFAFSGAPAYTRASQEDALRRLNQLVRGAAPTPALAELIDGLYAGGVAIPGTAANTAFVPAGWSASRAAANTYHHAVALACRGCHASREGVLDFSSEANFRARGAEIGISLCGPPSTGAHDMPNAEVTLARFWSGPARAYLVDLLGLATSCAPPQ